MPYQYNTTKVIVSNMDPNITAVSSQEASDQYKQAVESGADPLPYQVWSERIVITKELIEEQEPVDPGFLDIPDE